MEKSTFQFVGGGVSLFIFIDFVCSESEGMIFLFSLVA